MRRLLIVLGVPVDELTLESALERIDEFIAVGRASGKCHQIATINADFVVNALHDPDLRHILRTVDMATADGTPVVWAARLLGVPLKDRVAGADLVPALAARAAERGYSLYLLGGRPGVAARAAAILEQRYPGLRIVGVAAPQHGPAIATDPALLEEIRRARPDILLVALGNPKQEQWINMYAADLGVPVSIGVGGTLDMIAGVTKRAPRWSHGIGLEWLFRLAQEPRRLWRRYARDGIYFSWFFLRQWWKLRRAYPPAPEPPQPPVAEAGPGPVLAVIGRLEAANLGEFRARAAVALAESPLLVVDLSAATFLDSAALGALVDLTRSAREQGGDLALCALPQPVAEVIGLLKLDTFFSIYADVDEALKQAAAPADPPARLEREAEDWTVVRMLRDLDAYNAQALLDSCLASLEHNPRLVLDFSATRFLSSAGMAALVKLQRAAQLRGGGLRLVNCSREVRLAIELVRLDTIIPLYGDMPSAVAAEPEAAAALG